MRRGNLLNRRKEARFLYVIARRIHKSQYLKALHAPWQSAKLKKEARFLYVIARRTYKIRLKGTSRAVAIPLDIKKHANHFRSPEK